MKQFRQVQIIGLFLLMGAVFLAGCQQNKPIKVIETIDTSTLPEGHQIFLNHCASCHSSMETPPGPNAIITTSPRLSDLNSFTSLLRQPLSSGMPAFDSEKLSDNQVKALYEFVLSQK